MMMQPSIAPIMFIWMWLIGGVGIPLGVPPLPEDPAIVNVAPEECLLYVSSAGMASPDPHSSNQTEQLFAEPEVRKMASEIERAVRDGFKKVAQRGELPPGLSADDIVDLAKLFLTRPLAVYVSNVQISHTGPTVNGGLVINCGERADKVKTVLQRISKAFPPQAVEEIQIDGENWMSFKAAPNLTIVWGFKGERFFAGTGKEEIESMLSRAEGSPPRWLVELRENLPVERTSTVTYVNTKAVMQIALPMAGPQAVKIVDALGLSNVVSLSSVTGLDRKEFVAKTLWRIEGEAKGIFRLANVEPLRPDDLAVIPQDATFAAAFKLDPTALFDLISEIVEKIEPRAREEMDRGIARFEVENGLKLREDVLAPVGDAWRVFDSPDEGGAISGLTAVVQLKDPRRAAEANNKLVKVFQQLIEEREETYRGRYGSSPFFAMRMKMRLSSFEFKGREIHVYDGGLFGPPCSPAWCITEKELIVALNPQSIKGYLARGDEFKSLAQAPEVSELFRGESGPLKFAYCNSRRLFDVLYPIVLTYAKYMVPMMRSSGVELDQSIIPSARAIRPHLTPSVISARRTSLGIEIIERRTMPGPSVSTLVPAQLAFLLPAVHSARGAARRVQSTNNMKQIGLAMHNYAQANRTFPPAYVADKDGKPLLSWRVLILPYLEGDNIYNQFHLDEPWDSEHNKKLINKMPSVYRSPASRVAGQGKTNYLTVRGEDTVFPGKEKITFGQIRDGTSNTIMTVEVSDDKAVVWTKPDDFQYDEKNPKKGLIGIWPGGFHAGLCDGSVRFFRSSIDPDTLNALFTRNGGEVISDNELD